VAILIRLPVSHDGRHPELAGDGPAGIANLQNPKKRKGDQYALNEVRFVTGSTSNPLRSHSGGMRNHGGKRPDG
jgi:hypothetical protein